MNAADARAEFARLVPQLVLRDLSGLESPSLCERAFEVAVHFADSSGFTALTESLAQKEPAGKDERTKVLNTDFRAMIDSAPAWGGDVVKLAGDAMLASGPTEPGKLAESCKLTTRCALAMQAQLLEVEASGRRLSLRASRSAGAPMVRLEINGRYLSTERGAGEAGGGQISVYVTDDQHYQRFSLRDK